MSIAELVTDYRQTAKTVGKRINKKEIYNHLCCFVITFLYSLSGFSESFSPFGIAFVGCVSVKYGLSAVCGAAVGYFTSLESVAALRYTAAVFALFIILTAMKSFKTVKDSVIVPVVTVFVCLFLTGIAVVLSKGSNVFNLLVCFGESVVGAACVLAFFGAKNVLINKRGLYSLTSRDITSVIVSVTLLLLALKNVNFFGVYVSHILGWLLVLICAYYGKESGGAIVGVCTGLVISLGDENIMLLALCSLGGLVAGAFSSFGRVACAAAFLLSNLLVMLISYNEGILSICVELLLSIVLFMFLTVRYSSWFESIFKPSVTSAAVDSVRNDVVSKLKRASEFSKEICTSLTSVNDALDKNDNKGTDFIPRKIKNSVCGSCGLYDACWRENTDDTKHLFQTLLDLKRKGVYLEYKTVPQGLASSCIRTEIVSSGFNKLYAEAKTKEKLQGRVKEIHTLAAEQFVNMSCLLESICDEVNEKITFDMDLALKVKACAASYDCKVSDCCCTLNSQDILKIEVTINKPYICDCLVSFTNQIVQLTDRQLALPETSETQNSITLVFKEKTDLRAVCAGVQYNSNGEKYSGDSYSTFTDEKGYFYALICDGMGAGAKAAVSSSLAVSLLEKLIKAGFSVCSAINTVNTSLISKSGDECSVTLDLFVLDLYTGRGEFYKCGAADTVVKRKGKPINIGFDSLPLGILSNIEISNGNGMLSVGDVVVMCSDGVREEDYYTLRNELKSFSGGNVRKFTDELCKTIRKNQPEKNDDVTMLTIAIAEN